VKDFFKFITVGISLLLLVATTSCSPQRRFTKLITKYPELIETRYKTYYDTVHVIVNGARVDTIVSREVLKDTIVLVKDQLTVRVYEKADSVYIEGECDTVYVDKEIEVEVPVYYYEKEKSFWNKLFTSIKYIMWILVITVAVATVYKFIKSRK